MLILIYNKFNTFYFIKVAEILSRIHMDSTGVTTTVQNTALRIFDISIYMILNELVMRGNLPITIKGVAII